MFADVEIKAFFVGEMKGKIGCWNGGGAQKAKVLQVKQKFSEATVHSWNNTCDFPLSKFRCRENI